MESNERNALAKLAQKLEADIGIVKAFKKDLGDKEDEVGGMMMQDIHKAARIVAELAKQYPGGYACKCLIRLVGTCRAIAGEGANDGK